MGLACYLIWEAGTPLSALAFKLYGAQLIFNLAWQVGSEAVELMLVGGQWMQQAHRACVTAAPVLQRTKHGACAD